MGVTTSKDDPAGNLITYDRRQLMDEPVVPAQQLESAADENYASLLTYWNILVRRRWTVLAVACMLTALTSIAMFKTKPVYKAVVHINVEPDTPAIQTLNELYDRMYADDESFLQTQIQVLKSDSLAWRTVESLGLAQDPTFVGESKQVEPRANPAERKLEMVNQLKGQLSVDLVPKTRILDVGVENTDPELAARLANALVNTYIDYNFREKYDATRQVSGFMEQQLDELKAKVEKSQQALVDYERQNSIFNTGEKQSVQEQMLSDLSRELSAAQSDRIQKESVYNQIRTSRAQVSVLAHNELLQKLEEKNADLRGQYTEALNQYGPSFPKVTRLSQQVNENQAQIEKERDRVLDRIRNDYITAANREKLATEAVAHQKEELGKANQLLVQHNILQRDFEANQQLYQNLMQKLKDATVSAGLRSTNIHVVDRAVPPTSPIRPQKSRNIAIGMMAGLILGIMVAFAQEALDPSVKSVEDLEALNLAPALGVIPLENPERVAYGLLKGKKMQALVKNAGELSLTLIEKPKSLVAEAYRSLRTSVLLSAAGPLKTILITSAQPGDGKTATALNLAQALAQLKGPVLLVDGDLRKASIAKVLKLQNQKGLTTVLAGNDSLDEALQQFEPMCGLWVLPSGPIPSSPADLLASEKMAELLRECSQRFEHIVIDSPPVLALADAAVLAGVAERVVLIVAAGSTPKGAVLRAHRIISATGAKILGIALNKFDLQKQGCYGSGYYCYGYGKKYSFSADDSNA